MGFQIIPASRQGIKPLIGIYGKSGGGKTRSALMLARGLVGQNGRIALIDTENKRGHIFSDVVQGGYGVIDFDAPFTPERYIEAIEAAEKNADVVIVDSMTHEWSGEGGILEMQEAELTRMAGDDWKKREACKMAAWIKPKFAHKKMVARILRSPLPIICCLRGEEKTHIVKKEGKTSVVTDEFSSPLFDSRFIFEMLISAEAYAKDGKGGYLHIEKITHETLFDCLPKPGEQIAYRHGEALAKWCASPGGKPTIPEAPSRPAPSAGDNALGNPGEPKHRDSVPPTIGQLKNKLWTLTMKIHNGDTAALEKWLRDGLIIPEITKLSDLTVDILPDVIAKAEIRLKEMA